MIRKDGGENTSRMIYPIPLLLIAIAFIVLSCLMVYGIDLYFTKETIANLNRQTEDFASNFQTSLYINNLLDELPEDRWVDNIYKLGQELSPQVLMEEFLSQDRVAYAHYLTSQEEVLAVGDFELADYPLSDIQRSAIIEGQPLYHRVEHGSMEAYEVILPIYRDGIKAGTLLILYSLDDMKRLTKRACLMGLTALAFIFSIHAFMAVKNSQKNHMIRKLAHYDPTTGLYNKLYFKRFLNEEAVNNSNTNRCLLIIRCNNLNLVKLFFGQDRLQSLLARKAEGLKGLGLKEGLLFKYSEITFCIFLRDYSKRDYLVDIANGIIDEFDLIKDEFAGNQFINTRLGILEIARGPLHPDRLLKQIDLIIDKIGKSGDRGYEFFDETIQGDIILGRAIEKELRESIYDGYEGFYLVYQPQIDLKTNRIVGFEALLRWNNEELGSLSPNEFIGISEKFGLIIPLGEWVLEEACCFIKLIEDREIENIKVSVNISVVQLLQESFVGDIVKIIDKTGINPKNLELEITESHFMDNYAMANGKLKLLREKGISISLDDFGTGYTSLSRLKNLNIDGLKIDKSFIDNIVRLDEDDIFVKNIILLAKELGLTTVAEGVEREVQRRYLQIRDCDIMQGYLFSRPVPMADAINKIYNK